MSWEEDEEDVEYEISMKKIKTLRRSDQISVEEEGPD